MLLLLQLDLSLAPRRGAAPPNVLLVGETVAPMGRSYVRNYRYEDAAALQPLILLMEIGEITEDEFAALAVML